MLLSQLQQALLKCRRVHIPATDIEVTSITSDSRQVQPGSLFIAIRGYTVDGHKFAEQAADKGAVALLVEEEQTHLSVPQLVVPDTRLASAILADCFYGHPSQSLRVIGVTGTNGKTTTTHLIETILAHHGHETGLLGTVGKRIGGQTTEVANTTPEAVDVQATLAEMVDANCSHCVMEVSSHALELKRVAGTQFRVAVFTNLTQDHLDFHGSMENYLAAKGKLFSRLGNTYAGNRREMAYAVLNADDPASEYLALQTVTECVTYGIREDADVRAFDIQIRADGAEFRVSTFAGEGRVQLALTGRFNIYNALAAISVGLVEGLPLDGIIQALATVPGVPGRFERVRGNYPFSVLVDYSHTPDGLSNALDTIHEFSEGHVITVVGCGGDRDKTKRPLMAKMALAKSDYTVFTSDNPRTEDPEAILDDVVSGVTGQNGFVRISDREEAIRTAIQRAMPGDVVLIAGKGHETYQIIGRTKYHFDDREIAKKYLEERYKGITNQN